MNHISNDDDDDYNDYNVRTMSIQKKRLEECVDVRNKYLFLKSISMCKYIIIIHVRVHIELEFLRCSTC